MKMAPLVEPKPAPALNIPKSLSTVVVSIIDSTHFTIPAALVVQPMIGGFEMIACPSYTFLIQHPSGRALLFDLGIRKDWKNNAPALGVEAMVESLGAEVIVEKDVATILEENNVPLKDVEGIVWSHYHWDHTGDPSRFPASTALIVGPGFKGRFPNAYPSDEKSVLTEDAWQGRELREISFTESKVKVGRFNAFDYFGDGSFYLLDTPGHLLGHLCGLARTTTDTFILMGGDAAHHAGEIRPTEYIPLPDNISLTPNARSFPHICPGEILVQDVHPEHSATAPFYKPSDVINEVPEVAVHTIEGLWEFDADEKVFVVIAHDASLMDVVDFFPKGAGEWFDKGWGKQGHWRFLADFSGALEEAKKAGKV